MERVYSNRTTSSNEFDDDFQPKSSDSTKEKSNLHPSQVDDAKASSARDSRESPLFKRSTKHSLRPLNYPPEGRRNVASFAGDRPSGDRIPEIDEPQDLNAFYSYCDEKVNGSHRDSETRPAAENEENLSSSDSPEKGEQTSGYGNRSGRGRYRRRLRKKEENKISSSTPDNGASFSLELRKIYEEINLDLSDKLARMRESLENAKQEFDMQVKETAGGLDFFNAIYRGNEDTPRPSLRIIELDSDTDEDRKSINTETRRINPSEMRLIPTVCGPPEQSIDRNLPIKKSLHATASETSIKTSKSKITTKSERSMKSRVSMASQKTNELKTPHLQHTSRREFDDIELLNCIEQSESEKSIRLEESDSTVKSTRMTERVESIESIMSNIFEKSRQTTAFAPSVKTLSCPQSKPTSANERSFTSKTITSILSSRSKDSQRCNSASLENDQINKCKVDISEPQVKPRDIILLQWHDQQTQITEASKKVRRAWLSDKKPWHERRANLRQTHPPPLMQSSNENINATNKPTNTQKKRTVPPYLTMPIPPKIKKHSTKVAPDKNPSAITQHRNTATPKSSSVCDSSIISEDVASSPEPTKTRNQYLKDTPISGTFSTKRNPQEQNIRLVKPAKNYYARADKRSSDFTANNRNSHGLVELHLNSKSSCFFNAKSSIVKHNTLIVPEDLSATKNIVCQPKRDQTLGNNLVSADQEIIGNTFNITDKKRSKLHGNIPRDFGIKATRTLQREETFLVDKCGKENLNPVKRHISNRFIESQADTADIIITNLDFEAKNDLNIFKHKFSKECNSNHLDNNINSSSSESNSLNLQLHLSATDLQEHSDSSQTKGSKHTKGEPSTISIKSDRIKKSASITAAGQSSRQAVIIDESDIKNSVKINRWISGRDGHSESKSEPANTKSVFVNMGLGYVNRLLKKQNITLQRSKTDSQIPNNFISGPLESHHGDNWICDKVRDDGFIVSEKLLALEKEEFDNPIDLRLKRGDFTSQYTEAPIRTDEKTLQSMGMTTKIMERSWEMMKTSPWDVYEREVANSSQDIDEITNHSSSLMSPRQSCFRNMIQWFVVKCCSGSLVKNDN